MDKQAKILETIYAAVDEFNATAPADRQVQKTEDEVLFGRGGRLDSLGLVRLVVTLEEHLQDAFGVPVTLADEKAMSQKRSPFKRIRSLAEYIATLV